MEVRNGVDDFRVRFSASSNEPILVSRDDCMRPYINDLVFQEALETVGGKIVLCTLLLCLFLLRQKIRFLTHFSAEMTFLARILCALLCVAFPSLIRATLVVTILPAHPQLQD